MSTVERLRAMVESSAKASEGATEGPWNATRWDGGDPPFIAGFDGNSFGCGFRDNGRATDRAQSWRDAEHIAAHNPSTMARFRAVLLVTAKMVKHLRHRNDGPGFNVCGYWYGAACDCGIDALLAELDAALSGSQTIAE